MTEIPTARFLFVIQNNSLSVLITGIDVLIPGRGVLIQLICVLITGIGVLIPVMNYFRDSLVGILNFCDSLVRIK